MGNYILTKKTQKDLEDIWDYTFQEWSEEQADKYYMELIEACETIAKSQSIGRKYANIHQDLFGLPVNKHIIFYRKIDKNTVEITRILPGLMDIKSKFKK